MVGLGNAGQPQSFRGQAEDQPLRSGAASVSIAIEYARVHQSLYKREGKI